MKTIFLIVTLACVALVANARAAENAELKRIAAMRVELEQRGVEDFMVTIKQQGWTVPDMPSQWHVEHVNMGAEQKAISVASRELGKALAVRMEEVAAKLQTLPTNNELYQFTDQLLNFSDWCATTGGYGNVFLARRGLGLAAVGVARLTANLDFPLEKCEALVRRLQVPWMSAEARRRMINKDAGAEIFQAAWNQQEELEITWGSGKWLRDEKTKSGMKAARLKDPLLNGRVKETAAILANLSFFEDVEIGSVKPATLVNLWDKKWHDRIITGLELQSVNEAKALADFRSKVKSFPAAGKNAFYDAWEPHATKQPGMTDEDWRRYLTTYATAWRAYDKVQQGTFFADE